MEDKADKKRPVSQPKDKSLEAYNLWMLDIFKKLSTNKDNLNLTEEDWIANWKEYWKENAND